MAKVARHPKEATLYNDYHRTKVTVHPRPDGTLTPDDMAKVESLCGLDGCRCGPIRGYQDYHVDTSLVWSTRSGYRYIVLLSYKD